MADLAKLLAHRDALSAQIDRVNEVIAKQKALDAEFASLVSSGVMLQNPTETAASEASAMSPSIAISESAKGRRGPNGSPPSEIAAAAAKIIAERGEPMTRFELIQPLEAAGLKIGGVDKPRNLGTALWRSKRFESTGEGYWPKDARPASGIWDDADLGGDDDLGVAARK